MLDFIMTACFPVEASGGPERFSSVLQIGFASSYFIVHVLSPYNGNLISHGTSMSSNEKKFHPELD
jgi:hypothetical protein